MGVYKGAQAFQHFGGGWHLFHGLLRIEPAAGVVVAQAHRHGARQRCVGAGVLIHAPHHKPAGRGRRQVQVIALGIVAKQLYGKTGEQPQLFTLILPQPPGLGAKCRLMGHHIGQ